MATPRIAGRPGRQRVRARPRSRPWRRRRRVCRCRRLEPAASASAQRCGSMRGDGQAASPTQRPGADRVERRRGERLAHPCPQHRLVHRPGVSSLQPVIEPADDLGQEVVIRSGHAQMRVRVGPRPDDGPARHVETRQQPRDRVRVAIEPAADREDRDLDPREVFGHRPMPPEVVAALVPQPRLDRDGDLGHPLPSTSRATGRRRGRGRAGGPGAPGTWRPSRACP